jgi:aryl-alcohol dehydrogenase-like predicted oxidoreductase
MGEPRKDLYGLPFVVESFQGMPYAAVGRSGLRVSRVGLGTWKFGYPETGDGSRVDEKLALRIFDRAVELGVTFWDTANRYNDSSGNSERVIGKWLRANPEQRRNIVLATKLFGCMDGRTPNHCGLSRLSIKESLYACLERLQTDSVELLYLHAFDPLTPIEETLEAVGDLIGQDLVRYLGVSNFNRENLLAYHCLEQQSYPRIVAVQNGFNILEGPRAGEGGVLDYCVDHRIGFIPWSPLGGGLLTERYLDPQRAGTGDRLVDEKLLERKATEANLNRLRRLAVLAQEWACGMAELSLAYTLSLPGVTAAIPSVSKPEQLEANARAGTLALSPEQRQKIAEILKG